MVGVLRKTASTKSGKSRDVRHVTTHQHTAGCVSCRHDRKTVAIKIYDAS